MNLSDQGIPGEFVNSISISVVDQDVKVTEAKPSDAISGDGFPYMDIVQITPQGSFTNSEFDVRTDCGTYHLIGPDGRILFRIDDVSVPWS
jgi:hypothetical protein